MRRACALLVAGIAGVLALAGRAQAEDWLQTGHDARRTFASGGKLKLPLTDVWTLPYGQPASVAFGRVYSVVNSRRAGTGTLVCASARTGVVLWQQPLWANTEAAYFNYDENGPAISPDGVVFVLDAQLRGRGRVPGIRAFQALTGQPLGGYLPPPQVPELPAPLIARDSPQTPPPPMPAPLQFLGEDRIIAPRLLLDGDQFFTSLAPWNFMTWGPRSPARYAVLQHIDQRLNLSKKEFEPLLYHGQPYQMHVSAGNGVIVAGYWVSSSEPFSGPDFLACLDGPFVRWHRDFPWRVFSPCVENGTVFAVMSGAHGSHVIAALSAQDGTQRWLYPPRLPEPAGNGMVGVDPRIAGKTDRIVLADGKVFAFTENLDLVALDQGDGHLLWRVRPGGVPLAASRDYLFVRAWQSVVRPNGPAFQLAAVRLSDGKLEWTQESPPLDDPQGFQRVAISDGQIFARNLPGLTAFAPAERIFRLGIDSDRKELYQPEEQPAAAPAPGAAAPPPADYAADATVVRVPWNEPLAESSRKLTERRKIAPGLPLLLQVEWLDPQRAAVLGAPAANPTELPAHAAFVARCRALAAEYQPEHLDLAPEVNVYLARHPEQLGAVRDLLTAVVKEVRAVSGKTLSLLSLNCEVLYGFYGKGITAPFGKLEPAGRQDLTGLKTLLACVDELGLASCPQAAFSSPLDVPRDYFLSVKQALEAKRIIVTGLRAELRQNTPVGQVEQAAFLKHLTQNCYWLDAALVACPDLSLNTPLLAPSSKTDSRPVLPSIAAIGPLDVWRDVLRWERVERLTLSLNLATPPAGTPPA